MKRDKMFMTREEVQWLFDLTSMQTFELFRLMDKEHMFRIGLWDIWGSLILMTLDLNAEEKIEHIFALGDYNDDGWMTIADLKTLMICVTRGLSDEEDPRYGRQRYRQIHQEHGEYVPFKGKQEISTKDIRNYMSMDEASGVTSPPWAPSSSDRHGHVGRAEKRGAAGDRHGGEGHQGGDVRGEDK